MIQMYKSTSAICEIYEVSRDFFQRRIQSREFIINEHYIKQANTIRWDFNALERWWRSSSFSSSEIDEIFNKILPD
ncbi:hypothetical protein [Sulfurimonas sp. RIFCSPLOWO2_12_36_12]|uniref:hypothetical protein n=1 Tax=Sulfurimonas sp. RIFCSPLOWO2_12_36_12 TaxID=1802253 RepID=UPI0025EA776D|nr:hypothetical protein [Sulfurimonas sp. RIFCSPLOWO2_12_36_12]